MAKKSVKVSIIMPIYNPGKYLREALDSVINQTLRDIEIICVNDGSTDKSLDVIKEYAARDGRIRYIDKPNAGYGHTMNCGIDAASGEYIGIVEPDDFVKPDMYEILYKNASEHNVEISKANVANFYTKDDKYIFQEEKSLSRNTLYNHAVSPFEIQRFMSFALGTTAAIYNRKFINDNNIRYNETPGAAYQDTSFWFKTHCLANKIYITDKALYMYRRDNVNSSTKNATQADALLNEYNTVLDFIVQNNLYKFISVYFAKKSTGLSWYQTLVKMDEQEKYINKVKESFTKDIRSGYATLDLLPQHVVNWYCQIVYGQDDIQIQNNCDKKSYYLFGFIPLLLIQKEC